MRHSSLSLLVLVLVLGSSTVACSGGASSGGQGGDAGGSGGQGGAQAGSGGSAGGQGGGGGAAVAQITIEAEGFCTFSCFEVHVGETRQLIAHVLDADGLELTRTVTWSSDHEELLTVSDTGLAEGVAPGDVIVTATAEGVPGTAAMIVLAPVVTSVEVSPPSVTLGAPPETTTFTAIARGEDGSIIPDAPFTWQVGNPNVASIDENGLLTALADGHVVVIATSGFASGTAQVVVGTAVPLGDPYGVTAISAGGAHACAVVPPGNLACWGYNFFGQLGNGQAGQETFAAAPLVLGGPETWGAASAGLYHTCGLTTTGVAHCWGQGASGELGNGDDAVFGSAVPLPVAGAHVFVKIAAGGSHTCAIDEFDALYCWGGNFGGAVGDGSTDNTFTPVEIDVGTHFIDVATSLWASCAIADGGVLSCWGTSELGELGNGMPLGAVATTPGPISGAREYLVLDAYASTFCAIAEDSTLWCWGRNDTAQVGDDSGESALEPVQIDAPTTFSAVACGGFHTCAIVSGGPTVCWGNNEYGQLGDGTMLDSAAPVEVAGGLPFVGLAAGSHVMCGWLADGDAYCWGTADLGQLGAGFGGAGFMSAVPVPVAMP